MRRPARRCLGLRLATALPELGAGLAAYVLLEKVHAR